MEDEAPIYDPQHPTLNLNPPPHPTTLKESNPTQKGTPLMGHADAILPIDFTIPTANILDAASAIFRAGHGDDQDTPLEIVEQYLESLFGGGAEIESTPDGITLNWVDDTSPLGHNLTEDKERMNLIAPYVTGETSDPFIIMTWLDLPQRWTIRNKQVVVEQVAVECKVIGGL